MNNIDFATARYTVQLILNEEDSNASLKKLFMILLFGNLTLNFKQTLINDFVLRGSFYELD